MDTDWCLRCARQTVSWHSTHLADNILNVSFVQSNDTEGYCSKTCMVLDRSSVVHPLPVHGTSQRPKFDLPKIAPPQRTSYTRRHTRREARPCTLDSFSKGPAHNSARFRDEELIDSRPGVHATSRYTGRDRDGILVWAHAVYPGIPGHEDECDSLLTESSSMSDLDRFLARPTPFPLTAQNLAPPHVTVNSPRHALLNHTSTHYPPNLEDRTAPSLSLDSTSLLTPATDSVITPSGPSKPDIVSSASPKVNPRLGSLINKVCTWIVSPSRAPRASSEGNPSPPSHGDCVAVHSDETTSCCYVSGYGDKSSAEAVTFVGPPDTRLIRV